MQGMDEVIQRLRNINPRRSRLSLSDFDVSENTTGELSKVLDYKTQKALAFRNGTPFDLTFPAVETLSTDGNGDQTTKALSHNIVESNAADPHLVLFEGNTRVEPDSVDYAANEVTFTDNGTGDDLTAMYLTADQGQVVLKKVAPNNVEESLEEFDQALYNRRNHNERPYSLGLDRSPLQRVVPKGFRVQVYADLPFDVALSPQNGNPPVPALVSLPVDVSNQEVPGAARAVKADMSSV